jgi:hypothetical protein
MTNTPKLTTRDVLHQVDRRLSLIEEDLRSLDAKVDRTRVELDAKVGANFHWTVGLLLASWVTIMAAVLFK